MSTYKNLGLVTLIVTTAMFALPAVAGGHERGKHGDGKAHMQRMADELDLNDTQREQIKALHAAHRASKDSRREARMAVRKKMQALVAADTFDEGAARALAAEQSAAITDMMVERARHHHQVRKLLTPEQREKFDASHRGGRHHKPESGPM